MSYNTVFILVYIIHARVPFVPFFSSVHPGPIELSITLPAYPAPPPHPRYLNAHFAADCRFFFVLTDAARETFCAERTLRQ